ncbi:MAG: LCP family protein [bacterium]|nr:LCP family protein [bacterium]
MRYVSFEDSHKKQAKNRAGVAVGVIRFNWPLVIGATIIFVVLLFGYYAWSFLSGLKVNGGDLFKAPNAIVSYVANKDPQVKNANGRTNIALLGIGGKGHDGPYLSDTMIVASIDIKTGKAVLISLPRDIWVSGTKSKLNAVYAYGFEKGDKKGLLQSKEEYGKIVGLPIHYALRIDFGGFEKAINLLGGIDVTVDTAFSDGEYPIEGRERDMCGYKEIEEKIASESGEITVKKLVDANNQPLPETVNPYACRYELLSFKKGPLTLDGKTALKFVRSRHGTNNEGSDFARSRRQEKVITGIKEKVFSTETLLNPGKVGSLLNTFGESIEMDIDVGDYGEFFKLVQRAKDAKIESHGISAEGIGALLRVGDPSVYNGAYVLAPVAGKDDWSVVQAAVKQWIEESIHPPSPSPEATKSARINQ